MKCPPPLGCTTKKVNFEPWPRTVMDGDAGVKYLTHCFTRLGNRVHLVTLVAFTFVVAFEVDTYLTASIRVLAFVYVWRGPSEKH